MLRTHEAATGTLPPPLQPPQPPPPPAPLQALFPCAPAGEPCCKPTAMGAPGLQSSSTQTHVRSAAGSVVWVLPAQTGWGTPAAAPATLPAARPVLHLSLHAAAPVAGGEGVFCVNVTSPFEEVGGWVGDVSLE